MASQTGRTIDRYVDFRLDDSAGTLRQIFVTKIGDIGLKNGKVDVTALQDPVKGVLLDTPEFSTSLEGPFDTTVHGYLSGVNGLNAPLAFDFRFGIRHTWEAGEPTFGITGTATAGGLISDYTTDGKTWKATLSMCGGTTAPEWNTVAHT